MSEVRAGAACRVLLGAWLLCCLCLAPDARAVEPALGSSVEGRWYVLIHYTDDHAADTTRWHWEDHLWSITQEGADLRWEEYPIVVFQNQDGRFERRARGSLSRVAGAWEPNSEQREEIRSGLQVNDRGARRKTLHRVEAGAAEERRAATLWQSDEGGGARSASVVTFSSTWAIADTAGLPLFSWDDLLSSARTEALEGRTEFRCERVDEEGVVHGRFERDGVRHGRFRLYPTAAPSPVEGKKRGFLR